MPDQPDPATMGDVVAALHALTAALAPAVVPARRPMWEQLRWAPDAAAFGAAPPAAPGAPVPAARVAVNADGTPGHVVADELIESAWGNAVVDTIAKLWRRDGCGLIGGGTLQPATQQNVGWITEAWDVTAWHAQGADVVITPVDHTGVYILSFEVSTPVPVSGESILTCVAKGVSHKIPITGGQDRGTLTFATDLSPGNQVQCAFYSGHNAAISYTASLTIQRLAL